MRGPTPRPRSGGCAGAGGPTGTLKVKKGGGEEIPFIQGKELQLRFAAAAVKRYPTPNARGGGWEDQPHIQGAVAARAQEGLEELSHVEGQEGQQ